MAQKLGFGAAGGSSSWADDEDFEDQPVPFAASLPKVEEQERARAESPRREREPERRDRKYSNESHDRDAGHQGRYGDRGDRGGYRSDRHEDRGPRGGYEGERPKNPVPDRGPFRIYFGNLPYRITELDIVDFFGVPDAITDIHLPRDELDRLKGFAYVEFRDRETLVDALTLDKTEFGGRTIRIDVATEPRKQRSGNSFFEKRGDRGDRGGYRNERRQDDAPRERPRLSLQPRTAPAEPKDPEAQRKSIFGDAKPRDEAAFLERKKALEAEKKALEAEKKAQEAERKKALEAEKKANAEQAKKSREAREPRESKKSHDDAEARPAGGRGGRGRGERIERAGGRGRGGQADKADRAPAKKEEPKAKNPEPKLPKAVKIPAPAATKTKNAFDLLGGSDSDSD